MREVLGKLNGRYQASGSHAIALPPYELVFSREGSSCWRPEVVPSLPAKISFAACFLFADIIDNYQTDGGEGWVVLLSHMLMKPEMTGVPRRVLKF